MNWQRHHLGEFFGIKHGYAFKGEHFGKSGNYIVVTPGNFHEEGGFKFRDQEKFYLIDPPEDYILEKDDLIVAMTEQGEGLLGSSALVPEPDRYLHNQRLGLIIDLNEDKLNKKFLYYLFNTRGVRGQIRASATGTKVKHTAPKRILDVEVHLPDIVSQRKIADILSAYDNLIANNNRRIALLEESIHLLYRKWFVRLRFPGYEHVKIVEGVPEGWSKGVLENIAEEVRRPVHPSEVEPDTPYVGLEHIPRQSIALTEWGTSDEVTSNKHAFISTEILFGKIRPYFHKVAFAPISGICSSDTIVIKPKDSGFFGLTLATVSSVPFVDYASKTAKEGSKMPRANWSVMQQYPILIPGEAILNEFNGFVSNATTQIKNLILINRKLYEARDLLLPRLMNGEIGV